MIILISLIQNKNASFDVCLCGVLLDFHHFKSKRVFSSNSISRQFKTASIEDEASSIMARYKFKDLLI